MAAAYGEEVAASQSDGTIYDRRRYFRIIYFFTYHFLEFVFYEFVLGYIIGAGLVERGRERRIMRAAIKFRRLAVDMGGVLIKLGQFVSTRVDVLPESVIHELEGLQDEVEAEDFAAIQHVLIEELGERLNDFEHIDIAPIAAASLGQVYRAVLDGHKVVIKVQRPRIRQMVATDLAALAVVAR
jgi:predicted unusual protein kinase regulating ubiquinone biosynthesis (AarF/ABC1/UbiB family)